MSQLDFNLESETEKAIEDNAHLLEKIAIERIHVEWIKTLLGQRPQLGVQKFISTDCISIAQTLRTLRMG